VSVLGKLVVALVVALAIGLGTAEAADDPKGFVRNDVSPNQTLRDLLHGHFVVNVHCAERCLFATRLVADPLGRGSFEIGRTQPRKLPAKKWTAIRIPLNDRGQAAIEAAEDGLRIHGQTVATALKWKLVSGVAVRRKGTASWIRTCKWPR
jgi:hypothetical protein